MIVARTATSTSANCSGGSGAERARLPAMAPGDTARLYHRLTSYSAGMDFPSPPADHPLVLQDFVSNDLARWPFQSKAYPDGLPRVELPRDWPPVVVSATAALAGASAAAPLDLP